jgi:tRNA (guanine-N7-)-methyltransferase
MGEAAAALAAGDPDRDVLAVDIHTPGVGALLAEIEARGLGNVRIAVADAVELLRDRVAPGALDEVRVLFPDPWPKARHHKRRLVTPAFAALVASRLRPGGRLHLATDWADYAAQMLAVVTGCPDFDLPAGGLGPRPGWRPLTRFERQGLAKGHQVHDLIAVRR